MLTLVFSLGACQGNTPGKITFGKMVFLELFFLMLPLHLHAWKLVEREGPIKHTFFYRNSLFSVLNLDALRSRLNPALETVWTEPPGKGSSLGF
jgi:hypothetical protein